MCRRFGSLLRQCVSVDSSCKGCRRRCCGVHLDRRPIQDSSRGTVYCAGAGGGACLRFENLVVCCSRKTTATSRVMTHTKLEVSSVLDSVSESLTPKYFILGIFKHSTTWVITFLVVINSIPVHNKACINLSEEQSKLNTDWTRRHGNCLQNPQRQLYRLTEENKIIIKV